MNKDYHTHAARDDALVNDFCERLQRLLDNSPLAGLRRVGEDGRDNLRGIAEALLGQLNVVSRAEFDAQNAILAQTTAKLEKLEEKLAALEKGRE